MPNNTIYNTKYAELDQTVRNIVWHMTSPNTQIVCSSICGSRLKGYNSPNSDYDIRAIVIRPKEDYLKIYRPKDAIEKTDNLVVVNNKETHFDITIWDITKSLTLFDKSNCTVLETIVSSMSNDTYLSRDTDIVDKMLYPHINTRNPAQLAHHYLGNLSQMFGRRGGHRVEEALNNQNNAKAILQMAHMALSLQMTFDALLQASTNICVPSAHKMRELCRYNIEGISPTFRLLVNQATQNRLQHNRCDINISVAKRLVDEMQKIHDNATSYIDIFNKEYGNIPEPMAEKLFREILKE